MGDHIIGHCHSVSTVSHSTLKCPKKVLYFCSIIYTNIIIDWHCTGDHESLWITVLLGLTNSINMFYMTLSRPNCLYQNIPNIVTGHVQRIVKGKLSWRHLAANCLSIWQVSGTTVHHGTVCGTCGTTHCVSGVVQFSFHTITTSTTHLHHQYHHQHHPSST